MTRQEQRDALLDDLPGLAFGMRYAATSDVTRRIVAERLDALIAAVRAEEADRTRTRLVCDECGHETRWHMDGTCDCEGDSVAGLCPCSAAPPPTPDADRLRALEAALRNLLDNAESVLVGDDEDGEFCVQAMQNADIAAARALLAGEDAG